MKRRHQLVSRRRAGRGHPRAKALSLAAPMQMRFRWLLLAALATLVVVLLSLAAPVRAQDAAPAKTVAIDKLMRPAPIPDNVLGAASAPVTIVEYSSMTCPHCANFHKNTLPALRKYIDAGKVRYIVREFPIGHTSEAASLAAAASLVARCAGKGKSMAMIDVLYAKQDQWAQARNPRAELFKIAKQAGFTKEKFDKCFKDQALLDGILEIRRRGAEEYGVRSTPTFFINGKMLEGNQPLAKFEELMAPFIEIKGNKGGK